MDQKNPLYYEAKGVGPMNAEILLDGMNAFGDKGMRLFNYSPYLAKLSGATLRYDSDRQKCDLKVYHPENKDVDGDSCSIAVYDFYGLKLTYTSGGMFVFRGILTSIAHYPEGEEMTEDKYDGFKYLPPKVKSEYLPLAVELRLSVKHGEDAGE